MRNYLNKSFSIILALIFFCFPINSFSQENIFPKKIYTPVIYEIVNTLEKNHFKKNIKLDKKLIIKNYIDFLDSEKLIFTQKEVTSFTNEVESIYQLNKFFNFYEEFKKKSKETLNEQKKFLSSISDSTQLNSTEFIEKTREDSDRFYSQKEIKNYHILLLKSELISILLKDDELSIAKEKLTKRIGNRLKSLDRVRADDVFSLYANSITSIYDPHTNYLSPKSQEDFEINMSLSLEGIGAILSTEDGITKVVRLVPGGPAEKSGLIKINDKIVGVGTSEGQEIKDVRDWRIDEVVRLIRGPKNTKVRLEILPSSASDDEVGKLIEITRGLVKLEDQAAQKETIEVFRPDKSYSIGIIDLPAFYMDFEAYSRNQFNYKSSSKDVRNLLRELQEENVDGIILDLRGNSGGSLYEAYSLAKHFIGRGTVVQVMESNGSIQPLGHTRGTQTYNGPILLLVDKMSASASEILAGAIQDYKRGLIVGTNTFGKGTVQRLENLKYGQLKFTEQKFYRVSGKSTQNFGIKPDINLPIVYENSEIGETTLKNSLPYDDIGSLSIQKSFDAVSNIDLLQNFSKRRIYDSDLNQYIKSQKDLLEKELKKNLIPVNFQLRKSEKLASEEKRLFIENRFRVSLGLKPFLNFSEFIDADPEEINKKSEEIVLKEAAQILIDQINFDKPSRLSQLN